MVKRLLIGLVILCLLLALAVAAIPWWLPSVLRPLARGQDITFTDYQRVGYTRFRLTDVTYAVGNTTVTMGKLEAPTPVVWLLARLWGTTSSQKPSFRGEGWAVVVDDTGKADVSDDKTGGVQSIPDLLPVIKAVRDGLTDWIPSAELQDGNISIKGRTFHLPSALWSNGVLTASVDQAFRMPTMEISISWDAADNLAISASTVTGDTATFLLSPQDELTRLTGQGLWQNNRLSLEAEFGRESWVPSRAKLDATDWKIPGTMIGMDDYSTITGSATLVWEGKAFVLNCKATGQPTAEAGAQVPALGVDISAAGDLDSWRVEKLEIVSLPLNAKLSEPIAFDWAGTITSGESKFTLEIDLGKQSLLPATGNLAGSLQVDLSQRMEPRFSAHLQGSALQGWGYAVDTLLIDSTFNRNEVHVSAGTATLADGTVIELKGGYKVGEHSLEPTSVSIDGKASLLAQWFPPEWAWNAVKGEVVLSGPLDQLRHQGTIDVNQLVINQTVKPLDLQASWKGELVSISESKITLTAGDAECQLSASGQYVSNGGTVTLQSATITQPAQPLLALEAPATISFHRTGSRGQPMAFDASVSKLIMTGNGTRLELECKMQWPASGEFHVQTEHLPFALATRILVEAPPALSVDAFEVTGQWDNGPVNFTIKGTGSFQSKAAISRLTVEIDASGDAGGIAVRRMNLASQDQPLLTVSGNFPLILNPAKPDKLIDLDLDAAMAWQVTNASNPAFWEWLGQRTGWNLSDPQIALDFKGSLNHPQGALTLISKRLAPSTGEGAQAVTALTDIQLKANFAHESLIIESLQASINGHPIKADGKLPLGEVFWKSMLAGTPTINFEQFSGHVVMDKVELSGLVEYLPAALTTAGELDLDLEIKPGWQLVGTVAVHHGSTKPLGAQGIIRDIEARLRFAGRTIQIEELRGTVGGEPVTVTGSASFLTVTAPSVDLHITGQNVPLYRNLGVIIRSDIDLKIVSDGKNGSVEGKLDLRDCLLLSDIRDFASSNPSEPKRRPPYFSIKTLPYAQWTLAVAVEGKRFLKVQTPLFNGLVSAHFDLSGTLQEPRAIGDVTIDKGWVTFPFASFEVGQGRISLTRDEPYKPMLYITGGTKLMGYDLQMELSGSANEPKLIFSSTPPLRTEQILLLVLTGESPSADYSVTGRAKVAGFAVYIGRNLLSGSGQNSNALDRISVKAGAKISRQGRQTYSVVYRMKEAWSIEGEYDEFDAYNLGLKWRVLTDEKSDEHEEP
ncbi:MAG: translocation/assembly module TamB domain-containing protein [Verrucomicrobiota bacterium]|nr:translocation/assembly module TamB domain-containing protein [Verrucomicrobiota bacterium]